MVDPCVTVTTKMRFKRFTVPNFVNLAGENGQSYAIKDVEPPVLDTLAQAWLKDLYEKAGRAVPHLSFLPKSDPTHG